ncbi:uncharacterized protein LOC128342285 [Hemicordylus capensis]|uniref:uncharacterized protein LOC128342285 n=1 Tax=Hemicordylus capensis TaxID=884348 RepID=UPI002303EAAD|nr:uncharacterized protein LOC128342285 [Hemicordylus capensis]XP_053145406.1 uncharacterized protein LOC128342285 [Hemicordylus capensis]XP_053145407.1 uncharacterized protein LOC128342285 [Hemicordylus capensis]XP_053145408.1 uncharacterized protein LOC128342285 [Hemicordylus capensis]
MAAHYSRELILKNLLLAKNKEEPSSKLSSCFNCALEKLQREPVCVRSNAHLTISDGHTLMEFTSGNGECQITVFHNQGKVHYDVFVPYWDLYFSRLCTTAQPLSVGTILGIRSHLHSWGSSRKGFSSLACFDLAVERFPMEPDAVQRDAELLVECAGQVMKFISGQGSCKISVFFRFGEPTYDVQELSWDLVMERLRTGVEPLTTENLWRLRDKLRTTKWGELRRCLDEAIGRFCKEPRCVQDNAKMLIVTSNDNIVLISGKGENHITVTYKYGMIEYQLSERGWWEMAARVLQKKEIGASGSIID